MAAERLSPGVYRVNGKTIKAASASEAQKLYDKQSGQKSTSGKTTSGTEGKVTKLKDPVKVAGDFTDASKVAKAQDIENEQTLQQNVNLNRLNESNAFGNREFIQNPDGSYSLRDTLSDPQQKLLDAQLGTGTTGANIANSLLGGMPQNYDANSLNEYLPQGSDQARQDTYNATYGMIARDFGRDKEAQRQEEEQRLADRGYTVGSPQYNNQMNRFDQQWADRELSARNQAILSGNQEFQNSFGRGQQNYENRLGAYQSNFTLPTGVAGNLQNLGQVQTPQFGQGVMPIEAQGINFGDYYGTAVAQQAARRSGGGPSGGGQPVAQYPSMGGVAGAGTPQQPRGPSMGQNIATSITNGLVQGGVKSIYG